MTWALIAWLIAWFLVPLVVGGLDVGGLNARSAAGTRTGIVGVLSAGLLITFAIWIVQHPKRGKALERATDLGSRSLRGAGTALNPQRKDHQLQHPPADVPDASRYFNVWKARYVESSVPLPGARKDRPISSDVPNWAVSVNRMAGGSLQTDHQMISFRPQKNRPPILSLHWGTVVAMRVADASTESVNSRVVRRQQPLSFRTTPVSMTRSRRLQDAYLEIESTDGTFLFRLLNVDHKAIEVRIKATMPLWGAQPAPEASSGTDPADQLRKLAELRNDGIISDTEFEEKKTELLRRL